MLGVNLDHLAEIKKSTDQIGMITAAAAGELGLAEGTPVIGGGGDASLIGIGAGCLATGDTHVYAGTSGWVSTIVDQPLLDTTTMIAAIIGAQPGKFNYFAEMETAGKCLEWVKESLNLSYGNITFLAGQTSPGSGGVIFTPWLHGNRCPFEDANARGIFFNIKLETGQNELVRAVLEGVCYHLRWMLEAQEKKITTGEPIRFAGGVALSDAAGQMLADITGRKIETIENPQNAGAVGAAVLIGLSLGLIDSFEGAKETIRVSKTFTPDPESSKIYQKAYTVFKELHKSNKRHFQTLNQV